MVLTQNKNATLHPDSPNLSPNNATDNNLPDENLELEENLFGQESQKQEDREFLNRELSKIPGIKADFATEAPEEPPEEEAKHENKFFKGIRNFLAPVIDGLNNGRTPIRISTIGGALHMMDGFIKTTNLPQFIKNISYTSSILFSKSLTVLPNALKGIDDLVNNDFMTGFSKIYSLVAKQFQSKPANFSTSSGFFPGVQMAKLAIGEDKYKNQNFKSFSENIKFFVTELKNVIGNSLNEFKEGKNLFENICKIFVPVGLIGSTVIGSAIIGDEVSTPKAKAIGFFRNISGIGGDIWLLNNAYKEAKEEHGEEKAFSEMLKSNHFKIGFPYILASLGELLNRYTPEPAQDILAQFFCGANEIITAEWGKMSAVQNNPEPAPRNELEPALAPAFAI